MNWNFLKQSIRFDYIEFHLTDYCFLNCAECSHFAPIADKSFYNLEQFIKEIRQIAKILPISFDYQALSIRFMGGEPLLHPQVLDFCKITRELFPTAHIQILSNGLLLKNKSQEFFDALNNYNIDLMTTKYPGSPNDKNDTWIQQQLSKINKHSTLVCNSGFWNLKLSFNKPQNKIKQYIQCSEQLKCSMATIKNGFIYKCGIEADSIYLFKHFNIKPPADYSIENNRLDLFNCTYDDICKFINTPSDFCSYCHLKNGPLHLWSRSKKDITEWVDLDS